MLEQRKVCQPDDEPETSGEWRLVEFGDSEREVIQKGGGHNYLNADSLHPIHREYVLETAARCETAMLEREKEDQVRAVKAEYEQVRRRANSEWDKAQSKWAGNPKRLDAAERRIRGKYTEPLAQLEEQLALIQGN